MPIGFKVFRCGLQNLNLLQCLVLVKLRNSKPLPQTKEQKTNKTKQKASNNKSHVHTVIKADRPFNAEFIVAPDLLEAKDLSKATLYMQRDGTFMRSCSDSEPYSEMGSIDGSLSGYVCR